MAGKFLRGAFVQFIETVLIPLPNVVIFQFNPEQIVHTWTSADSAAENDSDNWLAVSGAPGESFSFTLVMDSNDMIADGSKVAQGIAIGSGLYTRLAALEMLLHPETGDLGLLGSVSLPGFIGEDEEQTVPAAQLPTVLFVWGPGRILPVVITSLSITETLYDPILLHPTHAEASVELQVMTPRELQFVRGPLGDVATVAYKYSSALRKTLAVANLANATESVIGIVKD
jgi:hypothetical protein